MVFCQERINHFMNSSPQPPSSEEPEKQSTLHTSEETTTQPSTASDSRSEETEQQPVHPASEETEQQPALSSDSLSEETEQQPVSSSEPNEAEASAPDEDADFEQAQPVASSSQPSRSGIFIQKGFLIAAACVVVVAALLVALMAFVNSPKDPPTDWIASYTPPASPGSPGKILYYLHWTNQNGELNGQMQLAANANGTPQSLTAPATGLYNRDNHIIYVVITINGQPGTLTGKINENNDTLTLNQVGAPNQNSQLVFHIGSENDYKQATKNLKPGTAK